MAERAKAGDIKLRTYDDLFTPTDPDVEVTQRISLSELYDFPNHPFKEYPPAKMDDMVASILDHGVTNPIRIRPRAEGGYEIISGHNRVRACRKAMLTDIKAFVSDLSDAEATIIMVDDNLQNRETILPSEKAFSYKMKYEALKSQGKRTDLTCGQNDHKLTGMKSRDVLAQSNRESAKQVERYIRLTYLTPDLLDRVDGDQLGLVSAVSLSYLPEQEQELVKEIMDREAVTPSVSQANELRRLSKEAELNWKTVHALLTIEKPQQRQLVLKSDKISRYIPKDFTTEQTTELIEKLLEHWYRSRNHEKEAR